MSAGWPAAVDLVPNSDTGTSFLFGSPIEEGVPHASGPSVASHGTQLTESMRVDVEYRFGTIPRILPPLSTIATPFAT